MPIPLLAALLPLVPLLTPVIPHIASWLGGDDAEDVARQVLPAVTAITGGSTDPAVLAQVLTDPSKAGELAATLGRIAADREKAQAEAENARLQAYLASIAHARDTTVSLAQIRSPIAYLAPTVCIAIFLMFAFVLVAEVLGYSTKLSEATRRLLDYLAIAAASYAIGSSAGSHDKDARLATIQRQLGAAQAPQPPAPAPPASDTPRTLFPR